LGGANKCVNFNLTSSDTSRATTIHQTSETTPSEYTFGVDQVISEGKYNLSATHRGCQTQENKSSNDSSGPQCKYNGGEFFLDENDSKTATFPTDFFCET